MPLPTRLSLQLSLLGSCLFAAVSFLNYRASMAAYLEGRRHELGQIAETVTRAFSELWRAEGSPAALAYLAQEDAARPRSSLAFHEPNSRGGPPRAAALDSNAEFVERTVIIDGAKAGALHFLQHDPTFEKFETSERRRHFTIALLSSLALALASTFTTWWQLRQRRGAGGPSTTIPSTTVAEARLDRDLLIEMMRERERDGTAAHLVSEMAHDLGSPLNVVAGRAEMLVDANPVGSHAQQGAQAIVEQVRKMTAIISGRLAALRPPSRPKWTPLGELLRRAETIVSPLLRSRNLTLDIEAPAHERRLLLDEALFVHVVASLLLVTARLSPNGSGIRVELARERGRYAGHDGLWGPGLLTTISAPLVPMSLSLAEELDRGPGLGLTVRACRAPVAAAGGFVSWSQAGASSLRFLVFLPEGAIGEVS